MKQFKINRTLLGSTSPIRISFAMYQAFADPARVSVMRLTIMLHPPPTPVIDYRQGPADAIAVSGGAQCAPLSCVVRTQNKRAACRSHHLSQDYNLIRRHGSGIGTRKTAIKPR